MKCGKKKIRQIEKKIVSVLSPDLLNSKWAKLVKESDVAGTGHCYIASESAYHLLGGKANGWQHMALNHDRWNDGLDEGETHHYIVNRESGEIVDPTWEQFGNEKIPYEVGIPCGFLTGEIPSKRCLIVLDKVKSI